MQDKSDRLEVALPVNTKDATGKFYAVVSICLSHVYF